MFSLVGNFKNKYSTEEYQPKKSVENQTIFDVVRDTVMLECDQQSFFLLNTVMSQLMKTSVTVDKTANESQIS